MLWWVVILIEIGMTVLSALLAKRPGDAQASVLGDINAPTAEEGRAIPWVAGRVLLQSPNCVWYGDLQTIPLKKGLGWMGFGKTVVIGYKYYIGMQLALCHGPVDYIESMQWDQHTVGLSFYSGGMTGRGYIALPNLFGGEASGGGVVGWMSVYNGDQTQDPNAYLATVGGPAPAYRGLCHVVVEGMYVGTSLTLKPMAFLITRYPDPFGMPLIAQVPGSGGPTDLGDEHGANPAFMIYDLMTSPVLGLCTPPGRFDTASFIACAQTLFDEKMAMSMILDTATSADAIITDICRHIDGVLYTDPATGLWTMKLARADYDPTTLDEYGPADIEEITQFTRGSYEDTVNEVKIEFTNPATFKTDTAQAQETANFAIRGQLVSTTIPFMAFTGRALSQLIAMRELKGFSYPFVKLTAKMNRRAWNLRMGGVFKLTWPALGLTSLVCRVVGINYGTAEDPTIEVQAIEDIFGIEFAGYSTPTPSTWVDPQGVPVAPIAQRLIEAPYFNSGSDRYVMTLVVRPDGLCFDYQTWVDGGTGAYLGNTNAAFTPSALLVAAYSHTATGSFVVGTGVDLGQLVSTDPDGLLRGDNMLLIDDELIAWQIVTDNLDGTFTLGTVIRGALDTVPADHALGARVWFVSNGVGQTQPDPYTGDLTVVARNLPENPRGVCDPTLVSWLTLTTDSRAARPYPPGNIVVTGGTSGADLVCTWNRRSRFHPGVSAQADGDVAEAGEGTVTVEILVGGVVKQTLTGLGTGATTAYTLAQRVIDDADATKTVAFRLTPVAGGLNGTPRTTDAVLMT